MLRNNICLESGLQSTHLACHSAIGLTGAAIRYSALGAFVGLCGKSGLLCHDRRRTRHDVANISGHVSHVRAGFSSQRPSDSRCSVFSMIRLGSPFHPHASTLGVEFLLKLKDAQNHNLPLPTPSPDDRIPPKRISTQRLRKDVGISRQPFHSHAD